MEFHNVKSAKDLIKRNKSGEIELNDKIMIGVKYYKKVVFLFHRK